MSNRIVKITLVALTLIALLPAAANAQRSARIRVSAKVVSSVIPETHAAIDQQLSWLAQASHDEVRTANQHVETERGFARISTERLEPALDPAPDRATDRDCSDNATSEGTVRITVAYTAN